MFTNPYYNSLSYPMLNHPFPYLIPANPGETENKNKNKNKKSSIIIKK